MTKGGLVRLPRRIADAAGRVRGAVRVGPPQSVDTPDETGWRVNALHYWL